MAQQKGDKRSRKKRKARTEVSSPSSSSGDESPPQQNEQIDDHQQATNSNANAASSMDGVETVRRKLVDPEQAFEEFYMKQATKEFANDLDKLRSAGDFNERSVPILIAALNQGRDCFSGEERVRMGKAGAD